MGAGVRAMLVGLVCALVLGTGPGARAQSIGSGDVDAQALLQTQNWGNFPTIQMNSSGNHVMLMQAVINRYGYYAHGLPHTVASCPQTYSGNVDGWFGQCTDGAVRNFRYGHGFSNAADVPSFVW